MDYKTNYVYTDSTKKYWWVQYYANSKTVKETVCDIHPFILVNAANGQMGQWCSITVEEYNIWNELNAK